MAEFITAMHQSQVEWRELLRRFIYTHSKTDYSWSRPNQRYLSQGLYLPALDTPALPAIVLAIDTSDSMSSAELAQIWSEIHQLSAELNPESVHVLQRDTRVSAADEYQPGNLPEELQAKGRGGTLFSTACAYVDENLDRRPACMIYCTDLYCNDYPDPPPDYPVLWLVTGPNKPQQDAPFGERIDLDFPVFSDDSPGRPDGNASRLLAPAALAAPTAGLCSLAADPSGPGRTGRPPAGRLRLRRRPDQPGRHRLCAGSLHPPADRHGSRPGRLVSVRPALPGPGRRSPHPDPARLGPELRSPAGAVVRPPAEHPGNLFRPLAAGAGWPAVHRHSGTAGRRGRRELHHTGGQKADWRLI